MPSAPSGVADPLYAPVRPFTGACVGCHKSKCKCEFAKSSLKCDRCYNLNKECVPHVSRQGKRKPKAEKGKDAVAAAPPVVASVTPSARGAKIANGTQGAPVGIAQNLQSEPSAQGGDLLLCNLSQNQDRQMRIPPEWVGTELTRSPDAAVLAADPGGSTKQPETTIVQQHSIVARDKANHRAKNINNNLSSLTSIPLRQWIKGAMASESNGTNLPGTTPISPRYLSSCLRIAVSLSKQISDLEGLSCEKLQFLPRDAANWSEFITVKVSGNDAYDDNALYEPELLDLDTLDSFFDAICEDDEIDSTGQYHNVVSAEICIEDRASTNHAQGRVYCLSFEQKLERIYSLGVAFYDLFSGGRLASSKLLPLVVSKQIAAQSAELSDEAVQVPSNNSGDKALNFSGKLRIDSPGEEVLHGSARKRPANNAQVSSYSLIESLKSIGLPCSVCEMIVNMLDCINGELSGDESYAKMADVTSDLELMVAKPFLYLHDLDVVSSTGLQLNDDNLFMREKEYALLQCAYQRATTTRSSECAVICGSSGTGKSHLALRLGQHITMNKSVFIAVKFDQLKQANPFSALMLSLNDYCALFASVKESDWVKAMTIRLQKSLGQDVYYLVKFLPNLSEILPCDVTGITFHQDCVNGSKKVEYLLTRFVEILSFCSQQTMTLWFDDLQYADAFSLSVLEQIMAMPDNVRRVFVIACYRDDEMEDSHPFQQMISNFNDYHIKLTKIQLNCMDRTAVNRMVSELLHLSPRLVTSLGDILYHKTKGNQLFFVQLLLSLCKDGVIKLDLGRRRYVWNLQAIHSREIPDDVAALFSSSISKLPSECRKALKLLSLFGVSVTCNVIETLQSKIGMGMKLVQSLDIAINEGFICRREGKYCFAHDRIQEVCYGLIQPEHRSRLHFKYGMALSQIPLETINDNILFSAACQLNIAGPLAVSGPEQSVMIANLNLVVGEKAIDRSEFAFALLLLKCGISFLQVNHWDYHYKLSLDLFSNAAKCALVVADFVYLNTVSEQVLNHASCFEDKIDTLFVLMSSLAYAKRISESIAVGQSMLSQLGHEVPTTFSRNEMLSLMKQTVKDLSSISDVNLLGYKKMTSWRHLMAMRCLARMQIALMLVNPDYGTMVTLKMVNMTIYHGLSAYFASGLAYFASITSMCGELQVGLRFTKLAKVMLNRVGSNEIAGDVIYMTSEVLCFHEPLESVNEHRTNGIAAVLSAGDIYYVCVLKLVHCGGLLWSGTNLKKVRDAFDQAARYMKAQNHLASYHLLQITGRNILVLMGEVGDDVLAEDQLCNPYQQMYFIFQQMFLSLILNNFDDLKQYAEIFFQCKKSSWLLLSIHARHEFFGGLAAFRIFRETGVSEWLERGKECKSKIELWEKGSSWNFEHHRHLLEAEYYFTSDLQKARQSFNMAIESSKLHRFKHDEALCLELAGYFYFETGDLSSSMKHFRLAHKAYHDWGAVFKCERLYEYTKNKFADFLGDV